MRTETQDAYNHALNYMERLMIAFWVYDGWDRLWPWTRKPAWLAPRYEWRQLEYFDSFAKAYDAKWN